MTKQQIKQVAELNRQARVIAEAHPDDYDRRPDYRAVVDQRSAVISRKGGKQ